MPIWLIIRVKSILLRPKA